MQEGDALRVSGNVELAEDIIVDRLSLYVFGVILRLGSGISLFSL